MSDIRRQVQKKLRSYPLFHAQDGIENDLVAGVQTCALPICPCKSIRDRGSTCTGRRRSLTVAGRVPRPLLDRQSVVYGKREDLWWRLVWTQFAFKNREYLCSHQ